MELDQKSKYIEVYADWHKNGIPGTSFYEKAKYEVEKGIAEVIAPNAIRLKFRQPPLKQRILERDKNICQYCGKYGDTIDHIIPQSKYKIFTTDEMVVCACRECNGLKANRPVHEFVKELVKKEITSKLELLL